MKSYRVLKDGIAQRVDGALRPVAVGAQIAVSDIAAPGLIRSGLIVAIEAPTPPRFEIRVEE